MLPLRRQLIAKEIAADATKQLRKKQKVADKSDKDAAEKLGVDLGSMSTIVPLNGEACARDAPVPVARSPISLCWERPGV